jgi:hypothetical protein
MAFPCPACGFLVFGEPVGSYEICPICDWEEGAVQLQFPMMRGGANQDCLYERQQEVISRILISVQHTDGYDRDPTWRPLNRDECRSDSGIPRTGLDYFHAIDATEPRYYWLEDAK